MTFPSSYPAEAGWKAPGTSQEAARTVDLGLRETVRQALIDHGPMTADQCAARLRLSVLAVRPRFSELRRLGLVEDTGARHANASGKRAAVWSARC